MSGWLRREIIGGCELYLGDCREFVVGQRRPDVIVTDPPYGIRWRRGAGTGAGVDEGHPGIANDQDTSARDFILGLYRGVPAAVFGSFYRRFPETLKQVLVWHKDSGTGVVGSVTGFRRDAEAIFLCGEWPVRPARRSSVIRSLRGQAHVVGETGHPHTKPVEVMAELIQAAPEGVVFDPFMGSGSTGVACVNLGRRFVGVEIDPDYFNVACRRIAAATAHPNLFHKAPEAEQMLLPGGEE